MSGAAFSAAADQVAGVYPLPPSQQGMLYHHVLAPRSGAYVPQMAIALRGPLQPQILRQAWQHLVARHGVLRTIFARLETAKPLQIILKQAPLPWQEFNWQSQTPAQQDQAWQSLCREQWLTPFELNQAPLMRLVLVRFHSEQWRLLWTHHHVLSDGWSTQRMLAELMQSYEQLLQGQALDDSTHPGWVRYLQWWQQQDHRQARAYWQQYLSQLNDVAKTLPLIKNSAFDAAQEGQQNECHWQADERLYQDIKQIAQQHCLTINTLIKAAWALILARVNDQHQICFGATLSGRPSHLDDVENIVGQLIQSVPVCTALDPQRKVLDWLQGLQREQLDHDRHCHLGLTAIQECVLKNTQANNTGVHVQAQERSHSQALFDTLLVFENFPQQSATHTLASGLSVQRLASVSQNHYPLTLAVFAAESLSIKLKFDHQKISQPAAQCYLDYIEPALCSLMRHLDDELQDLTCFAERPSLDTEVLPVVNAQAFDCALIDKAADDALALIHYEQQLTYGALRQRVYRHAHYLQQLELSAGDEVALLLPWGVDFIVAFLACQYAGCVPVLLDPQHPAAYLVRLLEDSPCAAVVCGAALLEALSQCDLDAEWVVMERDAEEIAAQSAEPLKLADFMDQAALWPAYKIFTSGSSGPAKAVLVSHSSVQHYCHALFNKLQLPTHARLMAMASVAADLGFSASLVALYSGRTLVLCDEVDFVDVAKLSRYWQAAQVDVLKLTPSHLQALLASGLDPAQLPPTLICGGEALDLALVRQLFQQWQPAKQQAGQTPRLFNHYGPTEATIGVLCHSVKDINRDEFEPASVPIAGERGDDALGQQVCLILDQHFKPVGPGGVGELYLMGPGLAHGYANDARATALAFTPCLDSIPKQYQGQRWYRTGDRALRDAQGRIHFLGRWDAQSKIRGYRVHPAQIEYILSQQDSIQAARVIVEQGELLAGVIGGAGLNGGKNGDLNIGDINAQLPAHQQLKALRSFEAWPLTSNGKLDRAAFIEHCTKPVDSNRRDKPTTATPIAQLSRSEQRVLRLWQQLLKRREIDLDQAFFAAGGHSLLLMQLHAQLQQLSGRHFPITQLFQHTSVRAMARLISTEGEA